MLGAEERRVGRALGLEVVNRQGGANARRTRLSNGHELWKGPSSTGHRSVVLPSPGHALAFAVLLPNLSYIMSHYGAHQRGPVATAHMHMLHTPICMQPSTLSARRRLRT